MALNIADLTEHAIDTMPDRIAIISGDRKLTYAELEEKANRLGHYLQSHGVGPGDKVGLYCRNGIEIVVALVAVVKIRAIAVNVNYRYVESELHYLFENSDMVALVHEHRYADKVANVLPSTPKIKTVVVVDDETGDDPACDFRAYGGVSFEEALEQGSAERDFGERSPDDIFLIYTGGTTGFPKGVMWRHEDIYRSLFGGINYVTGEYIEGEWDLAKQGAENAPFIGFPIPPMIHGATQAATFMALFAGRTTVLMPEFSPEEVWDIIEKHKVNMLFFAGDAIARPLIDVLDTERGRARDLSSLWVLASSAALFSQTVKERYLELLPNRMITDAIGASETGTGGLSTVTKGQMHPGGPTVKISATTAVLDENGDPIEPGSGKRGLIAKSGHIPVGYFKDEKKTAETFRIFNGVRYAIPGDWATVEADGTVTMLGRGSVSINTGGEKVFPEEVESVLKGHPAVFDALVVGVPDDKWGQHVGAVIAVRPGTEVVFEELDTHARKEIAGYKVPRSVWVVSAVKRNPAGKADYRWAKEITESRAADLVNAKHVNAAGS